jgi:hypothetical protein
VGAEIATGGAWAAPSPDDRQDAKVIGVSIAPLSFPLNGLLGNSAFDAMFDPALIAATKRRDGDNVRFWEAALSQRRVMAGNCPSAGKPQ